MVLQATADEGIWTAGDKNIHKLQENGLQAKGICFACKSQSYSLVITCSSYSFICCRLQNHPQWSDVNFVGWLQNVSVDCFRWKSITIATAIHRPAIYGYSYHLQSTFSLFLSSANHPLQIVVNLCRLEAYFCFVDYSCLQTFLLLFLSTCKPSSINVWIFI